MAKEPKKTKTKSNTRKKNGKKTGAKAKTEPLARYELVEVDSKRELERRVGAMRQNGWSLYGYPFVVETAAGTRYYQPMTERNRLTE